MAKAGIKSVRLNLPLQSTRPIQTAESFVGYSEAEEAYLNAVPEWHRKHFAQYFTPVSIAKLMCEWVLESSPKSILDPSFGLGVFQSILSQRAPEAKLLGLDVDRTVLNFASALQSNSGVELINADFLTWNSDQEFDAIVANPPYLRHHDFHYPHDIFFEVGQKNNLTIAKTMNMYGLFTIEICRRLKVGGRAAVIIPSEWMNSNFGQPIKELLLGESMLNCIALFSHEISLFDNAITTACILFIEKTETPGDGSVRSVYLDAELSEKELLEIVNRQHSGSGKATVNTLSVELLRSSKKWDHLLRSKELGDSSRGVQLKTVATTKRGIATGANEFFHLSLSKAIALGISSANLRPCIGRAADIPGLTLASQDIQKLVELDKPTHLLVLKSDINAAEKAYLDSGSAQGLPDRHLLAARKVWFHMEQREPAPILAAVQGRGWLKFVRNSCSALTLTAFHGIYPFDIRPVFLDALVVCLNSSIVQNSSKSIQRMYGGGLIKVQPDDLLDLLIPNLSLLTGDDLAKLASFLPGMDEYCRSMGELATYKNLELEGQVKALLEKQKPRLEKQSKLILSDSAVQASLFDN